jgi:hypothetical protein
VIAESGTV